MTPRSMTLWPWPWPLTFISKNCSLYWLWPWPLTYISKNFNLCHSFWTIRGRAFIFHVYIPCDEAFQTCKKFWLSDLDRDIGSWTFISKTSTLAITFEPHKEIETSYLACILNYETLSNDTRVNDLVNLTVTFILKITNFILCCSPGASVFHKHLLPPKSPYDWNNDKAT